MASVTNSTVIAGSVEPVFDLITTARFWPSWHPATEAVAGVTERPYQRADSIRERGRIATLEFEVTWRVAEHSRPERVVLDSEQPPARIIYAFRASGENTEFQRQVIYEPRVFAGTFSDAGQLEQFMHSQSEEALVRLKKLVEGILRQEKATG